MGPAPPFHLLSGIYGGDAEQKTRAVQLSAKVCDKLYKRVIVHEFAMFVETYQDLASQSLSLIIFSILGWRSHVGAEREDGLERW